MSTTEYAGFWLRLVAFIIDSIVLSVVYLLIVIPIYNAFCPATYNNAEDIFTDDVGRVTSFINSLPSMLDLSQIILIVIAIVYYAWMESSRYQASLGKLALELKVTDMQDAKLAPAKALLRNVCKIFSAVLFLGFLLAAFTAKKQTLHDILAGTLVVNK